MTLADKRIIRFKLFSVICFYTLIAIFPAFSTQNSFSPKIVKVGYYENEVFQEGAKEGSVKTGYAYDYYQKIAEYTGWQYEYVYGDFNTIYKKIENGEVDLIAGLAYRADRTEKILYPELAMGSTTYFLLKKANNSQLISNPESLNNKNIGVMDSAMVSLTKNWVKSNNLNSKIEVYNSQEALFVALEAELVDAIVVEGSGALGRNDIDAFIAIGKSDYYLCVSKTKPELLKALNEAQSQIEFDAPIFIDSLYSKYYPRSVSSKVLTAAELNWVKNHSKLNVGVLNNYLPYSDVDKKGEITGFIKDLIPEMLRVLNISNVISVSYVPYENSSAMIEDLNSGALDIIFPVGGGLYFSESSGFYQSVDVVKTSVNLISHNKLNTDEVKRIAVNKNNVMQVNYAKTNFPDAEIIYCDSVQQCLDTVKHEKDVCTTINGLRSNTLLKNSKYSSLRARNLNKEDERCFGIKIGNEGLLRIVNRGLNNITNEYILDAAYKYTDGLYKYSVADFFKNYSLFIMLSLVIITLIIFYFIFQDNRKKQVYLKNETKKNEELKQAQENLQIQLEKVKNLNLELKHTYDDTSRYITDMIRFASSEDSADEIINQLVNYFSEEIECDRIYIFERNEKGSYDNTYEWCNAGVTREKENLQNVPYEGVVEVWINEFKKSGTIIIDDIENYKNVSEPIYTMLKPQNIKTLVAIPIFNAGKITGFLGIDNPSKEKSLEYISDLMNMVEFIFSMMIRIRNNTNAIAESANHDQMTGCLNRKALTWAYEGKYKKESSCGVVSVDMNGLKKVNDSQGHNAGDKFICRMADSLRDVFGADNVYRMGGDEFICVLLDISAETFNKLLSDCKMLVGTTASIGGVFVNNLEKGFNELLKKSDQSMYKEKELFYQNASR